MEWLTVNVFAPVFLPLILLGLAKGAPAGRSLKLMETVKDGQLCWFAITLSCATFYELMLNDRSAQRVAWCAYGMAGMAMIGMLCGVYAVVAAIQPTPGMGTSGGGAGAWLAHYTVFVTSIVLSLIVALASLFIHTRLAAQP